MKARPSCSAGLPTAKKWKRPSGRWKSAASIPTGCETDGLYHANLFISRPPEEIVRQPVQQLVSVVSGANKLWTVGTNVLGSFGPTARKSARAERPRLAFSKRGILLSGAAGLAWRRLARRQQHDHLAAFEPRFRFDLGDRGGIPLHAVEQPVAELLVRHFAPAEAKGDFDFVAFFEEALH